MKNLSFVKWAGGKTQLMSEISRVLPKSIKVYFEPFIGGGAVLWNTDSEKYIINDINSELINLYRIIRDQLPALFSLEKSFINREDEYYRIRNLDRSPEFNKLDEVYKAARFLYLNKTGFNGLFRVNSNNQNNVPFGYYLRPNIFPVDKLSVCSKKLKNVIIFNREFDSFSITEDFFVYLDPPYVKEANNFVNYTSDGFNESKHYRLKAFCEKIANANGKFLMSNSAVKFNYNLYKEFKIEEVYAKRSINSDGSNRGKIKELLIRNY